MDIPALAAQAVESVAGYLSGIASGVVEQSQQTAAGRLYELVRDRLERTELGSAVLSGLAEKPEEVNRRNMVSAKLAEEADADEAFAEQLRQMVSTTSVSQATADHAIQAQQVNLSASGRDITFSRTDIAGGNIDKHRSYRLGTWGIVLAALLFGAVTTTVVVNAPDEPSATSPGPAPAEPSGGRSGQAGPVVFTEDLVYEVLPTIDDMPTGWTREQPASVVRVPNSRLALAGEANFTGPRGGEVNFTIWTYRSREDAKSACEAVVAEHVAERQHTRMPNRLEIGEETYSTEQPIGDTVRAVVTFRTGTICAGAIYAGAESYSEYAQYASQIALVLSERIRQAESGQALRAIVSTLPLG
ncbi:hypothetical protein [Saccharopolyspora sp. NPDC050642]|uniref:hypothetical protein n=1 Tax=Saccharopolyspora sp. NPDC050642 TaxID=3157099 RepID=UPI0033DB5EF4